MEEKTGGGVLLPTTAQIKPQGGQVVAVGEGKTIGKTKVGIIVQVGQVVAVGEGKTIGKTKVGIIVQTDDVKVLKPLNDSLDQEASKEKPSIGEVIVVGPGTLDKEGNKKPLSLSPGSTVLYSKYVGNDFKEKDGFEYIALRASDVIAILS